MKNTCIIISLFCLILGSCSQAPHWMDMSTELITPEGRSLTQGESIEFLFETEEFVPDGIPMNAVIMIWHNLQKTQIVEQSILIGEKLETPYENDLYELEKGVGKHTLQLRYPQLEAGEWDFYIKIYAFETPAGWTTWRREYVKRLTFTVLPNE